MPRCTQMRESLSLEQEMRDHCGSLIGQDSGIIDSKAFVFFKETRARIFSLRSPWCSC